MNWLKNYFKGTFSNAKEHPRLYAGAVFAICTGIVNVVLSTAFLSIFIGFAGIYGLLVGLVKLHSLNQYRTIQTFDNEKAIKQVEWLVARRIAIITAIMSFLHFSLGIVSIFFHEEIPKSYTIIFIFYFGGVAVIGLLIAVVNVIRTRKSHSMIIHHIKLISFANVLIFASLAQRIIFYHVGHEWADILSGIGAASFGILVALICLLMFRKIRRSRAVFNN